MMMMMNGGVVWIGLGALEEVDFGSGYGVYEV